MSANVFRQDTADGKSHLARRSTKQGRKPLPAELVRVKMSCRVYGSTKRRVETESQKYGMTPSAYADLALSLFDISKFSSDENCSNT